MINRRFFCLAIAAAALPVWAHAASYPAQPLRVIVSNAPGTGTDITARFLAHQAAAKLGQPAVVENKAGAGGVLATDFVARAEPDGYTILFSTGAHFSLPAIYNNLSFDPETGFIPVGVFAQSPMVLFVPADSPFRTVEDLLKAARKAPDTISYSSPGVGTSSHLAAVMMFNQGEVSLSHVPYKSASQAAMEVASGQAQVGVNGTGVTIPLLEAGKIRILAVTSLKRSASLPDVPTLDESGLKGYDFVAPILALVPAGTPEPIVQTLGDAFTAAAAQPEFKALSLKQGLDVAIRGPAELKVSAPKEFEKARRLSELAGVQAR